jgi:hypothetical protein
MDKVNFFGEERSGGKKEEKNVRTNDGEIFAFLFFSSSLPSPLKGH